MPRAPAPFRRARSFDTALGLLEWCADEGFLDDTWLDEVGLNADGALRLSLVHRLLLLERPDDSPPGDHSWWREREHDDVVPFVITCVRGALVGDGAARGYIKGYTTWEAEDDSRTGVRLVAGDGELRLVAARYDVEMSAIAHGAPRRD